jgi:hypothetical protein
LARSRCPTRCSRANKLDACCYERCQDFQWSSRLARSGATKTNNFHRPGNPLPWVDYFIGRSSFSRLLSSFLWLSPPGSAVHLTRIPWPSSNRWFAWDLPLTGNFLGASPFRSSIPPSALSFWRSLPIWLAGPPARRVSWPSGSICSRVFFPFAALCKKIRDEHGNWQPVEIYVSNRSEAHFNRTLCPDCLNRDYNVARSDD